MKIPTKISICAKNCDRPIFYRIMSFQLFLKKPFQTNTLRFNHSFITLFYDYFSGKNVAFAYSFRKAKLMYLRMDFYT